MEIEEGVIHRGNRLRQIIPSEMSIILKTSLHVNMLTSIDVKFIFDSASLSAGLRDKGLFSSANILHIEAVIHRVVFLLFMPCF